LISVQRARRLADEEKKKERIPVKYINPPTFYVGRPNNNNNNNNNIEICDLQHMAMFEKLNNLVTTDYTKRMCIRSINWYGSP